MNIIELHHIFINECKQKIATDTRLMEPGSLFFAWKGETHNGNVFVAEAFEKGCLYAVVDDPQYIINDKCFLVSSGIKMLQNLAKHHRKQFQVPVLAIGGSNGKTTTKNLVTHILSTQKDVVSSFGSLNNHVGVPKTLLRITKNTDIAVVEIGANHLGEIAELCEIAQPTLGLITNIGRDHIGYFGGVGAIIESNLELYEYLRKHNHHVFVHKENEMLVKYSADIESTSYGIGQFHELCTESLKKRPFVSVHWKHHTIQTQLTGEYNVENITAAIAIGVHFNITDNNIIHAIESYTPHNNRSELVETDTNICIKDFYNANRTSMELAIDNLVDVSESYPDKKTIAILGDMLELGEYSHSEHQAIVDYVREKKCDGVILVGLDFKSTDHVDCESYVDVDEAISAMLKSPVQNSVILFKASNGTNFSKLFDELEW